MYYYVMSVIHARYGYTNVYNFIQQRCFYLKNQFYCDLSVIISEVKLTFKNKIKS